MTLTREEIDKFAAYLEETARDDEELARQVAQMPSMAPLAKKYRTEALAARVISQRLRKTEVT